MFRKRKRFNLILSVEGDGAGNDGDKGGGGGGSTGNPWTESLPAPIREWEEVKNSQTPEKFWEQITNMKSSLGNSIRIPSKEAGAADIEAFHKKIQEKVPGLIKAPNPSDPKDMEEWATRMGRPAKPEEYSLPEIKGLDGKPLQDFDKTTIDHFKPIAHKLGLNDTQFKTIVGEMTNHNMQVQAAILEARAKDAQILNTQWGAALERNSTIVANFIKMTDAPEIVQKALESKAIDSATMMWMHKLATQVMGKETDFTGDANRFATVMTPDEAKIRISEIRNNKAHPYNNPSDPAHSVARKQVDGLYALAYPE